AGAAAARRFAYLTGPLFSTRICKILCFAAEILCRFFHFLTPALYTVLHGTHAFAHILSYAVYVNLFTTHLHFLIVGTRFGQHYPENYIGQEECTSDRSKEDIGEEAKAMTPAKPVEHTHQRAEDERRGKNQAHGRSTGTKISGQT